MYVYWIVGNVVRQVEITTRGVEFIRVEIDDVDFDHIGGLA